jgi:hypothetical protein
MYLPTFWKLIMENRKKMIREGAPWAFAGLFFSNNYILYSFQLAG